MKFNLQVISGKYRGMGIKFPDSARPTSQRARGAVFNMLQSLMDDEFRNDRWVVWDAFAGSGAMGIEFFSRFGADTVIWSDKSVDATAIIRENIQKLQGFTSAIRHAEAAKILPAVLGKTNDDKYCNKCATHTPGRPNWIAASPQAAPRNDKKNTVRRLIVFIDPPYSDAGLGAELIQRIGESAPKGTVAVWEVEKNYELRIMNGELSDDWEVLRDRTHGRARSLILCKITESKLSPVQEGNQEGDDVERYGEDNAPVDIDAIARRFVVGRERIPGGGKYKTIAVAANAIVAKVYPNINTEALIAAMYKMKQR